MRLPSPPSGRMLALLQFASKPLLVQWLAMNPRWLKKYAGTVVVTAVGMFGRGGGWGFGFAPFHTLTLTVGGIAEKPGIVNGQIVPREFLDMTLSIDHQVADGAPAARFAACFKELVESGYGLCQDF